MRNVLFLEHHDAKYSNYILCDDRHSTIFLLGTKSRFIKKE